MPIINKTKICNKHGFYNALKHKQCPKCKAASDKQYEKTTRDIELKKLYNTKKWAIVRRKALIRDDFLCVQCIANGVHTLATEVHHITPIREDMSKSYDLENLESICHACHMKQHA